MERRALLGWLVKGIGATVGAIVGIPAVITAFSPVALRRRGEYWVTLGPVESFGLGRVVKKAVPIPRDPHDYITSPGEKGVFVLRRTEQEIVVYSRSCTDLSCPLTWDEGSDWFYCPCHGGIFCRDGEPRAGPPSRPMFRYTVRIRDGLIEIDLNSVPPVV